MPTLLCNHLLLDCFIVVFPGMWVIPMSGLTALLSDASFIEEFSGWGLPTLDKSSLLLDAS